jgi:hypothetical protein
MERLPGCCVAEEGGAIEDEEVTAAVELLITTRGEATYKTRLKSLLPVIQKKFSALGWVTVQPDYPELKDSWPFLWYENEYVVDAATTFILAANAADALAH